MRRSDDERERGRAGAPCCLPGGRYCVPNAPVCKAAFIQRLGSCSRIAKKKNSRRRLSKPTVRAPKSNRIFDVRTYLARPLPDSDASLQRGADRSSGQARKVTDEEKRPGSNVPPGRRFISCFSMVRLAGIEPTTPWFVAKYSIQLSYSRAVSEYISGAGHPRAAPASWQRPAQASSPSACARAAKRRNAARRSPVSSACDDAARSSGPRALPHSFRSA